MAGTAIYLGIVHGENTSTAGGTLGGGGSAPETTSYYAGTTINTPIQGLSFGLAFDYRDSGIGTLSPLTFPSYNVVSGDAWTAAGYLSWQATEKMRLNFRADYANGSDGTFHDAGIAGIGDKRNELGALTFTLDYSLWANVVTRGEIRWDRNVGGDKIYHGTDQDHDAVTLTANIVYKF